MIQTDKLVQFYCAQYKTFAKKKHKKAIPETGPYPKRMQRLSKELLAIHSPKIKQPQLENYHRQLRNLAYFVYRDANPIYIMQFETYLVAELVRLDISSLRDEEPELITERFLNFLYQEMPLAICRRTLKDLCHQYGQFGMRHQIVGMVPLKPETRISTDQRHAAAFYPACWSYQLWQNLSRIRAFKRGFVRSLSWSFASSGAGNL